MFLDQQGHTDLMDKVAALSDAALSFTIKDLKETIDIQEKDAKMGFQHQKLGIYTDHWHYCVMEKTKRQKISG